jgi:hypothetical protein
MRANIIESMPYSLATNSLVTFLPLIFCTGRRRHRPPACHRTCRLWALFCRPSRFCNARVSCQLHVRYGSPARPQQRRAPTQNSSGRGYGRGAPRGPPPPHFCTCGRRPVQCTTGRTQGARRTPGRQDATEDARTPGRQDARTPGRQDAYARTPGRTPVGR